MKGRPPVAAEVIDAIRSLAGQGYSDPQIGVILDRSWYSVRCLRYSRGIPGGQRHKSVVERTFIGSDDIDEVAVQRLMGGDTAIPLKRATDAAHHKLNPDVVEAIRRLAQAGLTDPAISDRLRGRLSPRSVRATRRNYGITSGAMAGAA